MWAAVVILVMANDAAEADWRFSGNELDSRRPPSLWTVSTSVVMLTGRQDSYTAQVKVKTSNRSLPCPVITEVELCQIFMQIFLASTEILAFYDIQHSYCLQRWIFGDVVGPSTKGSFMVPISCKKFRHDRLSSAQVISIWIFVVVHVPKIPVFGCSIAKI